MTPYGNPEADLAEQAYDYLAQIPGLNKFLPRDVQVHRSPDGQFYCVNAEAEVKMQAQRLFAAVVGGPAVIYAGLQVSNPIIRTFIMGMGVACSLSHYMQYQAVKDAPVRGALPPNVQQSLSSTPQGLPPSEEPILVYVDKQPASSIAGYI